MCFFLLHNYILCFKKKFNNKMAQQNKYTLIAPISGGYCVNQMSMMIILQKMGIVPHIICGSSGGALAGVVANNSNWYNDAESFESNFYKLTEEMDSSFYFDNPNVLLSSIFYAKTVSDLSKSFLREPKNKSEKNLITFSLDEQPELWINTYCVQKNKETLWCTRNFDERKYAKHQTDVIGCDKQFVHIASCEELFDVTRAAISIPSIVPGVKIGEENFTHYDAGVICPSPFNSLKFRYLPANNDLNFKIIYLAPSNYSKPRKRFETENSFNNLADAVREVMYGLCVGDIQGCINMLFLERDLKYYTGDTLDELKLSIEADENYFSKSFLLIYPNVDHCANIVNLKKGDIPNLIKESIQSGFVFHHWYVMRNVVSVRN